MSEYNFNENIYLGTDYADLPFALQRDARRRHLYIIGQTGTGKSTLLLNLLMQDLGNGRGCALLDPHGDLAESALGFLPTNRGDHLVYFNPSDLSRPIGFNLLDKVPIDMRPLVADGVVSAFRHVWPEFWGPRLEHIFAHSVRTLMDVPNATLLCLPRLLQDEVYRASVLPHVKDPVNAAFWQYEYASYPSRFREEAIAPVLNKIGRVLMTPAIRNIIAQPKSTIDLRLIMDEGRVLIANFSKGQLGEGPAHLLGALLVTAMAQAALSRSNTTERPDFHLYVDEFQSFATSGFSLILSEARKYGLTLTLAHQYIEQLPDGLREAVFGNAGSMVGFRVGAQDAAIIARQLDLPKPEMLRDLRNYAAWANVLVDGHPSQPFRLDPYPPAERFHSRGDKLIKNSATRFGREHGKVEQLTKMLFNGFQRQSLQRWGWFMQHITPYDCGIALGAVLIAAVAFSTPAMSQDYIRVSVIKAAVDDDPGNFVRSYRVRLTLRIENSTGGELGVAVYNDGKGSLFTGYQGERCDDGNRSDAVTGIGSMWNSIRGQITHQTARGRHTALGPYGQATANVSLECDGPFHSGGGSLIIPIYIIMQNRIITTDINIANVRVR